MMNKKFAYRLLVGLVVESANDHPISYRIREKLISDHENNWKENSYRWLESIFVGDVRDTNQLSIWRCVRVRALRDLIESK